LLNEETSGEAIELLMKAARDRIARNFFIFVFVFSDSNIGFFLLCN